MPSTFQIYTDAALTTPLASLGFVQASDNSVPPEVKTVYVGSTAVSKTLQAQSNPGVDPINLSVVDANSGTGEPATAIKLALTSGGLAAAVAGAPLSLGVTILSGAANAVPVWIQADDATLTDGNYTDLSLETVIVVEA